MAEITRLLQAAGPDAAVAAEELLPLVYEELRRHAARRMARERPGQTLQPTALVHEAWLRLFAPGDRPWRNRAHFFAAAAEAMRRILIEHARRKARRRHGGDCVRVDGEALDRLAAPADEKALLIEDALQRLERRDPEKGRVVLLKFYGGYSNSEVAECLGVAERTVERHWAFAKAWLFREIESRG
ncbi:MAG TPA: ECF-type sigma factor [Opitutaceae bacterium]|nr:ECF-type sigma factor [Opitutaceae bacterium]